jgi:peptidoglycan/LPS O-acetylase OafA/YrhL
MHAAPARFQTRRSARLFRPDIEGLRAVAVLGVVLYHAHVGLLHGGFAGVDVFFVVSGYLITGLLWDELQRRGRVNLGGFYGRRARRLLPASVLVVVVTAIAARHLLPPLQTPSVAKDGLTSALYVANYRFAFAQTNYLNANSIPSPFQHYWSLGVEEQFYLLWPLLLIAASLAWRYRPRYQRGGPAKGPAASRATATAALAAVTVGSFFLSLWLTHADQPWAFFSLPARAWELGAGGVLALAAPEVRHLPTRAAQALAWGGLALIVAAFLTIGSTTPFPGTAALLPVLGAAAVLAAGQRAGPGGPVLVLGQRPMRTVGRISYSWYLWHWPFLILAPLAVGHVLNLPENLLVAALSGLVATLTFLLVETPARNSAWLSARPRRSLLTGGGLSAAGAVACLLVVTSMPALTGHGLARIATIRTSRAGRPVLTAPAAGRGPTTTLDPLATQVADINGQVQAAVARSVGVEDVPANLTPPLAHAKNSNSPTFYDGCMDSYLDATVRNCAFGEVNAGRTVVLFGDSHAAMWFPALDEAANAQGFRLLNLTKATCPPIDIPIFSPELNRPFTECETWRTNVLARLAAVHPALVVLGVARHYTSIYGFTPYDQAWLSGLTEMITQIRQLGARVMMIGPIPKPPDTVPDCLSAHLTSAGDCTFPLGQTVNLAGEASERATVLAAGGFYVTTEPWFCAGPTCAVMVDNLEMWRDDNHISEPYSAYLGPALAAEIARVMPPA